MSKPTASASVAPNESVISTQVRPGPQPEADGRAQEEREEEDVREAELRRVVLAGEREGDRERVEDLRLLLDDHLRRPLEDGVRVHRDDQHRDEQHPAHRFEEGEEPPARARHRGELDEVRGDVEPGELEEDGEDDERDDGPAERRCRRRAATAGARARSARRTPG